MKIHETKNYLKFVVSPLNRDVRRTQALEVSMQKYGWLDAYPLHVKRRADGYFEIVAGHHRFHVAMKLGIDIKFVVVNSDVSIHELERATVPWTMKDWLISHIRTGKADYVELMNYHKQTGISIGLCIGLLGNITEHGRLNKKFKEGNFKIGVTDRALVVGEIIVLCKSIGISFARDKMFVSAVDKITLAAGFKLETLKKKIANHTQLMQKQPTMKSYMQMLENVYNHASKTKIPLVFNAEEAVRQRSAAMTVPARFSGQSLSVPDNSVIPRGKRGASLGMT